MSSSSIKNRADSGLVQIGGLNSSHRVSSQETNSSDGSSDGMTRRNFLKILGSAPVVGASAATLSGCSDDTSHNALPNVFGQDHQVPGVSVWYNSTCQECSAGCGISVRTREGRAVKVEGNRVHPLSKGGLCALGQSSLQALYDPDRIRQPLKKNVDGTFSPITWKEAIKVVGQALKFVDEKIVLISGEQTGSLRALSEDFVRAFKGKRVVYDALQASETAKATELVFGERGVPRYRIEDADLVLNFGADFLETWESPVQYARSWADGRRGDVKTRVIHIEPRLSLTGANADKWVSPNPGSELLIATYLLKTVLDKGRSGEIPTDAMSIVSSLTQNVSLVDVSKKSGVSEGDILLLADKLLESRQSLVISGGAAGRSQNGVLLASVVHFLNLALGNIGKTVDFSNIRRSESDTSKFEEALNDMRSGDARLVFVANGANPVFTLPTDYGFEYAVKAGKVKLLELLNKDTAAPASLPYMVSFSSVMDETAKLADIILPSHHSLEDWGDVEVVSGVRTVVQPVMTPVFDTKGFGDQLIELSRKAKKTLQTVPAEVESFQGYVKKEWLKIFNAGVSSGQSYDSWWQETLDQGGRYFDISSAGKRSPVVNREELSALISQMGGTTSLLEAKADNELVLYPYFSVKSFDGRAANRPWLQELPDPIVQAVWDSWGELHPQTAKQIGVKQGDTITVRNKFGEVNVPVYITDHVAAGVVAIPIGQGHSEYGRYAREVSSVGNVFSLLPKEEKILSDLPLVSTTVMVKRARKKSKLVITQGSDSQQGRHLARTLVTEKVNEDQKHGEDNHSSDKHDSDKHSSDGHGKNSHDEHASDSHSDHQSHHHEPKQMYNQRQHPIYEWVMSVDLSACTGCSACVTACFAENNIPVVGKEIVHQGREMSWLRIDRYYDKVSAHGGDGHGSSDHGDSSHASEELQVSFMPMMCQHCNNAPCEPVCPVYATYHNEEGLNVMVYNRCVGTRYCGNNCSYKVRRFNWFEFEWPEPMNLQLNPDVTKRSAGVMERCSFCVQRIQEAKDTAKDRGRHVQDGEVQPACVQSCPTQALAFGNINDPKSNVYKHSKDKRAYKVLDHHLNTQPSVTYLENVKYKV